MVDLDVHVAKCKDEIWFVARAKGQGFGQRLGQFRLRSHALAFARAVAHSNGVELVVHENNGRLIRHTATSLTYPSKLN